MSFMGRSASRESAPLARTTTGTVRGIRQAIGGSDQEPCEVSVFRGIPYAEAPIGVLRYAPPMPREPWDGVLDATGFGPTPMRGEVENALIPEQPVPGDDIFSVNIWSPTLAPARPLPVIVWIHGGGFISGSPASPWYDGRAFARDGVVLVTLSYRLGYRGFGWIEGATPNRGVLDWICALEWVRDNIAAFGGDPNRVTIAGQSAGGSAVLALLDAPRAAGLFHGAYAMSPAIANPSVEAARERAVQLARLAGVSPDVAGFLSIPESRVLELQRRIAVPAPPHLLRGVQELLRDGLMIGPLVDGKIVRGGVEHAVAHGANAAVPLVIGTADDELSGFFHPGGLLDHAPRRLLLRALGATAQSASRWLAHPTAASLEGTKALLGRYATDEFFRSWVPRIARSRGSSPAAGATWTYCFSWHGSDPPYAGHCSDLPFVFDRLDAPGVARVAGADPPQELADAVHGALVRFARDRDPGWPSDADGRGPTRIYDLPPRDERDAYDSVADLRPPEDEA